MKPNYLNLVSSRGVWMIRWLLHLSSRSTAKATKGKWTMSHQHVYSVTDGCDDSSHDAVKTGSSSIVHGGDGSKVEEAELTGHRIQAFMNEASGEGNRNVMLPDQAKDASTSIKKAQASMTDHILKIMRCFR